MAEYDEEGMANAAAKVLISLRNRMLRRWPEWASRPSEEPAEAEAEPPLRWLKRRRAKERSKAATAWPLGFENLLAHMGYGPVAEPGVSCRREDAARSRPPRVREKAPEVMAARRTRGPMHRRAAAGSGPSASEKAREKKDSMEVSSPETPLDYSTAADSGASSSGEVGARSPAKRKASGSSGDEGCSSPAKRTRADAGDQATSAAHKVVEPRTRSDNRDEKGCLLFDLNQDPPQELD